MLRDLFASPHNVVAGCKGSIFPLVILCCHVHDIVVQSLTRSSHCRSSLAHHHILDLLLKQFNIFLKGSRLACVIAKVVKLVHRIDTLETNLVRRLGSLPCIALSYYICVELPDCTTQLASEAYRL